MNVDILSARRLPVRLRVPAAYLGSVALVLAIGTAVPLMGANLALKIAGGVLVILVFLRFRYALLVAWVVLGTFVGSTLTLFSGRNINTGLTVPTLLLMFTMPLSQTLRRVPPLALLFLYLIWVLAGIEISPLGTAEFMRQWLLYLDYAAVAVLTVNLVSTRRRLLLLIDAMLGVGAFIGLYGIAGYFTHQSGWFDPLTGDFRIASVFSAAPPFALFLSLVIPLAIFRAAVARGTVRAAALGVVLILLMALALTFSRGALFTLPFSLLAVAFLLPTRRMRVMMLGGAAGLVVLAFLLAAVGHVAVFYRFFGQDITSLNGRTFLWRALIGRLDPWQLLGNGMGSATATLAKLNIGNNGIPGNGLLATAPSNVYVGTLYDFGVIGLMLLLSVFVTIVAVLIVGMRRMTGEHRLLFTMALLILINVLIQSIEQDDVWVQGIALYFWIAVSLPCAACWREPGRSSESTNVPIDAIR